MRAIFAYVWKKHLIVSDEMRNNIRVSLSYITNVFLGTSVKYPHVTIIFQTCGVINEIK